MIKKLVYYGFFVVVSAAVHAAVILPWRDRPETPKPARDAIVATIVEMSQLQDEIRERQRVVEEALDAIDAAEEAPVEPTPAPPEPTPPEAAPTPPEPTPPAETEPPETHVVIEQEPDPRWENLLAKSEAQQREIERLRDEQRALEVRREEERASAEERLRAEREVAEARREEERAEERALREELTALVREQAARLDEQSERIEDTDRRLEEAERRQEQERARLAAELAAVQARSERAEAARAAAEEVASVTRAEAQLRLVRMQEEANARAARDAQEREALARQRDALARERDALQQAQASALAQARAQAADAESERQRREAAERELRLQRESSDAQERDLARRLADLDDWARYRRAAEAEPIDSDRVPLLNFPESMERPEDFRDLISFYGMQVIVFPPAKQDLLVQVDLHTGQLTEIRDPQAFFKRFASWQLRNIGPQWQPVLDRVAERFRRDARSLQCSVVFPRQTAGYFAWKQLEAIRAAGLDRSEVTKCYGRYRRDPTGRWVVDITMIETRGGRQHNVR